MCRIFRKGLSRFSGQIRAVLRIPIANRGHRVASFSPYRSVVGCLYRARQKVPLNTLIFSALNQNNEVPKELRRISAANLRNEKAANLRNEKAANLRNEKAANLAKSFIINNIN